MFLSKEAQRIIASLIPVLKARGPEITTRFYNLMFADHPELLNIFSHSHQRDGLQQQALARSVYAAAAHITNLEAIEQTAKQIAHKHCSLNIQPEQYPIVGNYLTLAIQDVLGEIVTPEILLVWQSAYAHIADYFISMEQEIYSSVAQSAGGWLGFRSFTIKRKVDECEDVLSLYLEPSDGQAIMSFQSGQYVTVKVHDGNNDHLRQYSLVDTSGQRYYRLSIKRENGSDSEHGIVSSALHDIFQEGDTLEISAPYGIFTLDPRKNTEVVLLAGGIGITPLMSLLKAIETENPRRKVTIAHAVRERRYHPFAGEIKALVDKHFSFSSEVFYEVAEVDDLMHEGFAIQKGRITAAWLQEHVSPHAEVYVCGPHAFMQVMISILLRQGHPQSQIHWEVFGPALAFSPISSTTSPVSPSDYCKFWN